MFRPVMKAGACLLVSLAMAFAAEAQSQHAFRVAFKNKDGGTADIHAPGTFLSARALTRRSTQHINVDSSDLPVPPAYIDSVVKLTGGILHVTSRWLNQCVVLVDDTSDMQYIKGKPFIKEITYVAAFTSPLHDRVTTAPIGNPKEKPVINGSGMRITGTVAYYGDAYSQITLANGDYLHDKGYRGNGKIIAVIDAGFNYVNVLPGFDSLRNSGRIADTYNFNLDTSHVYGYSNHGMEVLSTMAGILPGLYVGTAPDASYALYCSESLSTEQPYEMDNLLAAMERADSIGADVVNISLGYNYFNIGPVNADLSFSDLDGKSTIATKGVNKATEKGMLMVVSAGNQGADASWAGKILTPADADSALTTGSVTGAKTHVITSGNGPNAAGHIKPDVCMLGSPSFIFNTSGTVTSSGGTSYATPELAGLAACLWQAAPTATPYKLRTAIRNSAHNAASPNTEIGYGVPDFGKAAVALRVDSPILPGNAIAAGPNPFIKNITLLVSVIAASTLEVILYDIQGRALFTQNADVQTGDNSYNLVLPDNMPAGLYFLKVKLPEATRVIKLVHSIH